MKKQTQEIRFNKQIFFLAADEPGISRSKIAKNLGVSLSKISYDIKTLTTYGLLTESFGNGKEIGRHATEFRVHCPMVFRIFDLSARTFGCYDYTADGSLLRSVTHPYFDPYPFETNLEMYADRLRQNDRATNLMCAMLLPSPERFLDPSAPMRPDLPTTENIRKKLENLTGRRIICTADRVTALAKGTQLAIGDSHTYFGLHLGEEVFSVFLVPGHEPIVQSLRSCLVGDVEKDSARIAQMAAGSMYFSGTDTWHIYAERRFFGVKEQIEQMYPNNVTFPKEAKWSRFVLNRWVLRYLSSKWLDHVCAEFNRKFASKG